MHTHTASKVRVFTQQIHLAILFMYEQMVKYNDVAFWFSKGDFLIKKKTKTVN
jgi:hypothetical protein